MYTPLVKKTALLAALFLMLSLCFNLFPSGAYAADVDLTIELISSVDEQVPGQDIVFSLKYANPSTTTDANNVVITDTLPPELTYVSYDSSVHIDHVTRAGNTVTFYFADPLPAGSTGVVKVTGRFPDGTTLDGTTATHSGTINGDNSPETVSNEVTVTAVVDPPDWGITKTRTVPSGTPVVGQPVTYRVRLTGNSTGGLDLHDVRVLDTLPAGVTDVSATNGGVYDSGSNTVTWDIGDVAVGATVNRYVTMTYPAGVYDVTSTVTNTADGFVQLYGDTEELTQRAEASHGFTDPAPAAGNFSKANRQGTEEYSLGQTAVYSLNNISNTGNVPLEDFVVEDTIPDEINLTRVTTGRYNTSQTITVRYQTNLDPAWTVWGTGDTAANTTLNISDLSLTGGEYVTMVQWDFGSVPIGFSRNQSINLYGAILDPDHLGNPVGTGDVITNHATLSWTYDGTPGSRDASVSFTVVNPVPWFDPAKSVVGDSSLHYGETVEYRLRLRNHNYATGDLANPIAIEVLPLELENPQFTGWDAGNSSVTTAPVTSSATRNIDGEDRTVLTWAFEGADAVLGPGEYVDVTFTADIIDNTLAGTVSNTFYLTTNDPGDIKAASGLVDDSDDLDDDGQTTDKLMPASTDIFVKFQGSLESHKWVKGELDDDWSYYGSIGAGYGQTLPGGVADYQLRVRNHGSNGPISNVVIIDILPFFGDIGVLDTSDRDSLWRPYLVDEITGQNGDPVPAGIEVYYSTNPAPSCEELDDPVNNTGQPGDGWSATPPADITTVRSLKIDFGSLVLDPGDEIILEWPMRAPVGAPVNDVAWNSFGYGATYPDGTGSATHDEPFLPSEPIKVGFLVNGPPPAKVNIGDFVWHDLDMDGVQDLGEPGINGVLVNLYRYDQDPDVDIPWRFTRTGDTHGGDPGYYTFPDLDANEYLVEFVFPDDYHVSPLHAGDGAHDSDIITGGVTYGGGFGTGRTALIDVNADNLGFDAGLYLPASVGDYVWNDLDADGVQDSGEPPLSGVTVTLTDQNGDPVTDFDGDPVLSDTTDAAGHYGFANLNPGRYQLQFAYGDTHFLFTDQDIGTDDSLDSDADTDGSTAVFTLVSGEDDRTRDAGLHRAGLGNLVWHDLDADGIQDAGESGINGVTVTLHDAGDDSVIDTATTANGGPFGVDGHYEFMDLTPGEYYIVVSPPAGYAVSPALAGGDTARDSDVDDTGRSPDIQLSGGELDWTWDAGLYQTVSLGDYVWEDTDIDGIQDAGESGVDGVAVHLYDAGADGTADTADDTYIGEEITSGGGAYVFDDLVPGDYYLSFDAPAGYAFTRPDVGADAADSDGDTQGATAVFTLVSGADDMTRDAGLFVCASMGDTVWHDKNYNGIQDGGEKGIGHVTVRLLDGAGDPALDFAGNPISTTTDGSGGYLFDCLVPGTYAIEVTKPGYRITKRDTGSDDGIDSDIDNSRRTVPTDLSAGENDLTWDAGFYRLSSLGNRVWLDSNRNGIQDGDEPGVAGIIVRLYTGSGAFKAETTTAANGTFLFTDLIPGNYIVEFELPSLYTFTQRYQSDTASDSNPDTVTWRTDMISLSSGEDDLTIDAGIYSETVPVTGTPYYNLLLIGMGILLFGVMGLLVTRRRAGRE